MTGTLSLYLPLNCIFKALSLVHHNHAETHKSITSFTTCSSLVCLRSKRRISVCIVQVVKDSMPFTVPSFPAMKREQICLQTTVIVLVCERTLNTAHFRFFSFQIQAFAEIDQDSRSVILTSGTLSPMSTFASELGCKFPIQLEANHVVGGSQVCGILL